jgi:hypothetical protein
MPHAGAAPSVAFMSGVESQPPAATAPLSRGRRLTIAALLVAGTVLAVTAILAVFVNRQALDADNWSETSTQLLEDATIRNQIASFLVDEAYGTVDVKSELAAGLPPRLKPLAGPASGGLRTLAERVANRALAGPRVQELWRQANRLTAQQFIDIAEGDSRNVSVEGDAVVLNLRVVLSDLIRRLGLPNGIANRLPPSAGTLTIMNADQVSTAQNGVTTLRSLAVVLPALAIAFLALAVALARGRRRRTLLRAGIGLIVAGLLVLLVRMLAGDAVVSALASTAAAEPAAEDVWTIGTRMLRDVAQASIILGIPVVAAAWLAAANRPATALRRLAAPTLRDRPGVAYGVAMALLLVVIAWGPIPATRLVIPVLLMAVLVVVGVAALRRQTAVEFPDAKAGAGSAALRTHASNVWQTVSAPRRTTESVPAPAAVAAPTPAVAGTDDHLGRLERLSALHHDGTLTDDEFAAEKALLLTTNGSPR